MRERVYKITNDDDPMDYQYPKALPLVAFAQGRPNPFREVAALAVKQSVTVGGGAAVQFTITRIR